MKQPLKLRDFQTAMRWLERHVAVLETRREYSTVDDLQRRMRAAEALPTQDDRCAGLVSIAYSEGFKPEGEAV